MARTRKQERASDSSGGPHILVWILVGLLGISVVVNFVTILAGQGLKRTVRQMRDPVQRYFIERLDEMETEMNTLAAQARSDKGRSPYDKDIRKLSERIDETRELWVKTSAAGGSRWVTLYWRAQRKQSDTEQAWEALRAKLTY